jgi:hypothetical protein
VQKEAAPSEGSSEGSTNVAYWIKFAAALLGAIRPNSQACLKVVVAEIEKAGENSAVFSAG